MQTHSYTGIAAFCGSRFARRLGWASVLSDTDKKVLQYFSKCFFLENLTTELRHFFVHVACGLGSVLLRRRCDMLCTSGFVDDVKFS